MEKGKDENWHSCSDEDWSVLGCYALSTGEFLPAFRRDVVHSSSLSGSPRRARISSLLGLPEPEGEGSTFNREVGSLTVHQSTWRHIPEVFKSSRIKKLQMMMMTTVAAGNLEKIKHFKMFTHCWK
jgi:hypothetical protein